MGRKTKEEYKGREGEGGGENGEKLLTGTDVFLIIFLFGPNCVMLYFSEFARLVK